MDVRDAMFLGELCRPSVITSSDGLNDDLWMAYGRDDDCQGGDRRGSQYTDLQRIVLLGGHGRVHQQPVAAHSTKYCSHCEIDDGRDLLGTEACMYMTQVHTPDSRWKGRTRRWKESRCLKYMAGISPEELFFLHSIVPRWLRDVIIDRQPSIGSLFGSPTQTYTVLP